MQLEVLPVVPDTADESTRDAIAPFRREERHQRRGDGRIDAAPLKLFLCLQKELGTSPVTRLECALVREVATKPGAIALTWML